MHRGQRVRRLRTCGAQIDRIDAFIYSAQKGGFLGSAAKEGIALLFPDTSPRGAGIEGEEEG